MATQLLKDITRELLGTRIEKGKYKGRILTITLEAGDLLTFRVKGTRQTFTVPLAHCFRLAQLIETGVRYKMAVEQYKEKQKAGYKRLRKPKRPSLPFSKVYFDATKNGQ